MVKSIKKEGGNVFQCEECKYVYEKSTWAKKCESWCKQHGSCNLEITSHSIK